MIIYFATGIYYYQTVLNMKTLDAVYLLVATMNTVGYGDINTEYNFLQHDSVSYSPVPRGKSCIMTIVTGRLTHI